MKKLLPLIFLFGLFVQKSFSQTIPVGTYAETLARMNQLLGISDDVSSFTQNPLNSAFNSKGDSVLQNMVAGDNLVRGLNLFGTPLVIKILPFNWLNDYNSKLPFGYNNGPLYPNVGYQTMISGGLFLKAGILNIQFKPELVYAENKPFLTFGDIQVTNKLNLIPAYWGFFNGLDAPERFGSNSLKNAGPGQSKISLIYKNIEAGVSTENLWWGPGMQNSIMMSNSAPGFLHWTFNSAYPVKTVIGSFEWQIIGGILKQSGFDQFEAATLPENSVYYVPKPIVKRYNSAFTLNWHPKWINGLYLGGSGYDYLDIDSTFNKKNIIKRFVPVFFPITSHENATIVNTRADGQDYAYAINLRQLIPQYNTEVYFEYARNDGFGSITDLVLEPEHSSAYTIGTNRIFILKKNQFFKVTIELTHLQIPNTFLVRDEPSFYVHTLINPLDGYTNEGRYLGAGIGPGGNSFMFDISYIRNINSFGIKFERLVNNNDLYYAAFEGTNNPDSEWVDFSATFYANIKLKKFLISAECAPVYVYNYEYAQGYDVKNTHARINLTYYFN